MSRITVLGAGTWGMALALLLNKNGHQVKIWSALKDELDIIEQTHTHTNLPKIQIPNTIQIEYNLQNAITNTDVIILAVASVYTRTTARKIQPFVQKEQLIVNVAKGIEEDTLMCLTSQIEEEIPDARVCVLSGPSHAEEVSQGLPTSCVIAAKSRGTAEYLQNLFMSPVFRVYISPDILGIELGGALKNVIALAAGIADGLGYGDNAKAALITRGMAEISRLAVAMGAKVETMYGLSGIGDLIVTCASMHSRNRRAGILLGKGYTLKEAIAEVKMVVEGVYSVKAAKALSKQYQIPMPIVNEVYKVLFEDFPASEAVANLMLRDKTIENPLLSW